MQSITQDTEDSILGRLVSVLIEDGYRVEISDQDGGGLYLYAHPDNGKMPKDGASHWIRLVAGNGTSFISDYSVNLEKTIKPVNDFVDGLEKLHDLYRRALK